jgi:hypothetical protein
MTTIIASDFLGGPSWRGTLEVIPRIGEWVIIEGTKLIVKEVIWNFSTAPYVMVKVGK